MAYKPWYARAKRPAYRNLVQAAGELRHLARHQESGTEAEGKAAIDRLLQAAVDWRESAKTVGSARGLPPRPRPRFVPMPELWALGERPKAGPYYDALRRWASRYAWDVADGLPTEESANGLIMTALVGKVREKYRKAPADVE